MTSLSAVVPQGEGGQPDKWVPLDSSSISSVAFIQAKDILKVNFKNGDTWAYEKVNKSQYTSLLYSGSAGKYLQKEIIPYHKSEKLHDGVPDGQ